MSRNPKFNLLEIIGMGATILNLPILYSAMEQGDTKAFLNPIVFGLACLSVIGGISRYRRTRDYEDKKEDKEVYKEKVTETTQKKNVPATYTNTKTIDFSDYSPKVKKTKTIIYYETDKVKWKIKNWIKYN